MELSAPHLFFKQERYHVDVPAEYFAAEGPKE